MAARAPSVGGGKRRRTRVDGGLCLVDLPHETLAKAAAYLPLPSAALFVSALTAPSSSWQSCNWARRPSPAGEAIVSALSLKEACIILDLGDVDKRLAKKLSDGDLGALLACIDAKSHVKRLKLTGCWSVVGHGLEPLRGSTVLEQLDLSMVKEHEKPNIGHELSVCEQAVLPILWAIVDTPGNALRQLQLPENWTDSTHIDGALRDFLQRYDRLLESRPFYCAGPDEFCVGCTDGSLWVDDGTGLQRFTCYKCLNNFCAQCREGSPCRVCRKFYCAGCSPSMHCRGVGGHPEYGEYECNAVQCIECEEMIRCQYCPMSYCFVEVAQELSADTGTRGMTWSAEAAGVAFAFVIMILAVVYVGALRWKRNNEEDGGASGGIDRSAVEVYDERRARSRRTIYDDSDSDADDSSEESYA